MKRKELECLKDGTDVTVTLNLENGDVECSVVATFKPADREYIALLPITGPDAETGNVYLYYLNVGEDDEVELGYIYDDADYEVASDAFDEYLDSIEFDELVSEEEDENKETN